MEIIDQYTQDYIYKTLYKSMFNECLEAVKRNPYKIKKIHFIAPKISTCSEDKNMFDKMYSKYLDLYIKDIKMKNHNVAITEEYGEYYYRLVIYGYLDYFTPSLHC